MINSNVAVSIFVGYIIARISLVYDHPLNFKQEPNIVCYHFHLYMLGAISYYTIYDHGAKEMVLCGVVLCFLVQ
jgi:hypothetical protein